MWSSVVTIIQTSLKEIIEKHLNTNQQWFFSFLSFFFFSVCYNMKHQNLPWLEYIILIPTRHQELIYFNIVRPFTFIWSAENCAKEKKNCLSWSCDPEFGLRSLIVVYHDKVLWVPMCMIRINEFGSFYFFKSRKWTALSFCKSYWTDSRSDSQLHKYASLYRLFYLGGIKLVFWQLKRKHSSEHNNHWSRKSSSGCNSSCCYQSKTIKSSCGCIVNITAASQLVTNV